MREIPDFLDRKKNPLEPATVEERREYASRTPTLSAPVKVSLFDENREEKKQKSRERIKRMKTRIASKVSLVGSIPDQYLRWDSRRCRFYDAREKERTTMTMAKKIAEYNSLAEARGLVPRKWFKNLKAVEDAIIDLAPNRLDTPLSNVPSTPQAKTTVEPAETKTVPLTEGETEVRTATARKTKANGRTSKMATGQAPNARAFKQVRPGTIRAKVLTLMDGTKTAEQIGKRVGQTSKGVLAHAYCLTRDCGIGYSLEGGKVKALYPQGQSLAKAIKKD